MSQEIELTRGYKAVVDDDDFERFGGLLWQAIGKPPFIYAGRAWRDGMGTDAPVRKTYLHREIMGVVGRKCVKALNGNPLDCRKENLSVRK